MVKKLISLILFFIFFSLYWNFSAQTFLFRGDELIPAGRLGQWYRGDTHFHTDHSDGGLRRLSPLLPRKRMVLAQIKVAKKKHLDFLMITDHRTLSNRFDKDYVASESKTLLIPSEEWGLDVHATIWGIHKEIENYPGKRGLRRAVWMAHSQGALIGMAHPARRRRGWQKVMPWDEVDVDTYEVWSTGWFNNPIVENRKAIQLWETQLLDKGRKITAVGSSDSHVLQFNVVSGVGYPTTVVFATELSEAGILDGIKRGHVYVTSGRTDIGLSFEADADDDGIYETMMGDEVQRVDHQPLSLRVVTKRAQGRKIKLISSKGLLAEKTVNGDVTLFEVTPSDLWYRIEVFRGSHLEALTNPIYVKIASVLKSTTFKGDKGLW